MNRLLDAENSVRDLQASGCGLDLERVLRLFIQAANRTIDDEHTGRAETLDRLHAEMHRIPVAVVGGRKMVDRATLLAAVRQEMAWRQT